MKEVRPESEHPKPLALALRIDDRPTIIQNRDDNETRDVPYNLIVNVTPYTPSVHRLAISPTNRSEWILDSVSNAF
jgi:hypothetical protein